MFLHFSNGEPFSTGATRYIYRPASNGETSPRILLTVAIEGVQSLAFVDTGGVYLLCNPHVAASLNLNPSDGESYSVQWRRDSITGSLHRVSLTLYAEDGESLTNEVTAFVPHLDYKGQWVDDFPCILGMQGCLERFRFAVDPNNDVFYFGELATN